MDWRNVTFSCDLTDPAVLEELANTAQEYKRRLQAKTPEPYPDAEIETALKELMLWCGVENYEAIWLHQLTKKTAFPIPMGLEMDHAAKMTRQVLYGLRDRSQLWNLDYAFDRKLGALQDEMQAQGDDLVLPQNLRSAKGRSISNLHGRITSWVNSSGVISSHVRKAIGPITTTQAWNSQRLPTMIYDASIGMWNNLPGYPIIFALAPYAQSVEGVLPLRALEILTTSLYTIIPIFNRVIMVERPETHVLEGRGQLHRTDGPAIWFPRLKKGSYFLNNVAVPKSLAVTPAEKLDPKEIAKIKNVEVRREFVRKVGIERLMDALGAQVVDESEGYQLVDLNIGDGRYRPYLKMPNPSIQAWHIEGVPTSCRTVAAALKFRNGTQQRPAILT